MMTKNDIKERKELGEQPDVLCELSNDELMEVTGGGKPIPLPIVPED